MGNDQEPNEYQKLIIKQIAFLLNEYKNNKKIDHTKSACKIVFNHLIRWYPQFHDGIDAYGKREEWKNLFLYSQEAAKSNDDKLHPEHNPPVEFISKKIHNLLNNDELFNGVESLISLETAILKIINDEKYNIIILSKDESKCLDGAKGKTFDLHGMQVNGKGLSKKGDYNERIQAIGVTVKRYENWEKSPN